MKLFEKNIDGKLVNFYFYLFVGRSIIEMREVVSCYMIYVIFMIYYECISDSDWDINMFCC